MNTKRIALSAAIAVAIAILVAIFYLGSAESSHPGMDQYMKVVAAARAYAADLSAKGSPIPESVTLQELVAQGFLPQDAASAFEGMEVEVALQPSEARPDDILMRVRLPSGDEMVALGDGSVQRAR